jgi:uncharacterized protein YkwD
MPSFLRPVLLAAALLLVPAASAQAEVCVGADTPGGSAETRSAAVRCLVQHARAQAGRSPLHPVGTLSRSARIKAVRIDTCAEFSHTPCGAPFEAPMRTVGYARGCFQVAENLAWVTPDATPRDVLQAWLDSPAHRATLLSPRYRDTGIARRDASLPDEGDVELWVQHFGKRC